jgi:hypothetical protein
VIELVGRALWAIATRLIGLYVSPWMLAASFVLGAILIYEFYLR